MFRQRRCGGVLLDPRTRGPVPTPLHHQSPGAPRPGGTVPRLLQHPAPAQLGGVDVSHPIRETRCRPTGRSLTKAFTIRGEAQTVPKNTAAQQPLAPPQLPAHSPQQPPPHHHPHTRTPFPEPPKHHRPLALRSLLVTNPGLASKLTWYFPIPVWSPPSLTASRSTPPRIGAAPRPYFSALTPIDTLVSRADRTADLPLAVGRLCRCWCGRYGRRAAGGSCLTFLRLAAIQQLRAACPRR
jgi:hypothetical protein